MHKDLIKNIEEEKFSQDSIDLMKLISELLVTKGYHEKRPQNYKNLTRFNGVGFWFDNNKLLFTTHPKTWNVEKMKFELYTLEAMIFRSKGIEIG